MKFRISASLAAVLALVLLSQAAIAAGRKDSTPAIPAVVLPIEFGAGTVGFGGSSTEDADVAVQAKARLEHSLKLALARHGAFAPVALPPLTPEEAAVLEAHLSLVRVNVLGRRVMAITRNDPLASYTIGPALQFVADRSGAEFMVYLFGRKSVSTVAVGTAAALSGALSFLGGGSTPTVVAPSPVLKNTGIGAVVVELRTGLIRWMNFVEDINANVTEPGGANAYMLPTFGDYPKSRLGKLDAFGTSPPGKRWVDMSADFEVQLPAGWLRMPVAPGYEMVLTRRGPTVDAITIMRSRLAVAFKGHEPGQVRAMEPLAMAKLFVEKAQAEVGAGNFAVQELEPVTVSGRPGFRLDARALEGEAGRAKVPFRLRMYGVVYGEWLYLFTVEAVANYFEESLPDYEQMVASLQLRKTSFKR